MAVTVSVVKQFAIVALLSALVGCTAAPPESAPLRTPAAGKAPPAAGTAGRPLDAPKAQMQIGTEYARGSLVRACGSDRCQDGSRRRVRPLRLREERLVMFVLEKAPKAAAVEIRRAGSRKVVARETLRPGTTMPYVPTLEGARYEVILDGEWPQMRARWRFVLTVAEA